jgi:uncharacterized membrane protein (DUF485 family)
MGGFHSHAGSPAQVDQHDTAATSARNARYGLVLFIIYSALYLGFMLLSAFWPQALDVTVAGLNVAIIYGVGLILAAFVLALVYSWLCRDALANNAQEESQ